MSSVLKSSPRLMGAGLLCLGLSLLTMRPEIGGGAFSPLRSAEIAAEFEGVRTGRLARPNGDREKIYLLTTWTGTSCPSFEVVQGLNRCSGEHGVDEATVLLPPEFSDQDLHNYKANLGLEVPVERADPEIASRWSSLAKRFGKGTVARLLLCVRQDGIEVLRDQSEILHFLSKACRNPIREVAKR